MSDFEPRGLRTWRWIAVALLVVLYWGFHTGRLIWTGPSLSSGRTSLRLSSYTSPAGAPTAQVHPEVLNLQASFAQVADLVKPAVVNIATVHVEKIQAQGPEFFFGDPFEEFFQQFFGGQGNPGYPFGGQMPRPRVRPREFKMEGVGSGVVIDPDGLVLTNEHVVRDADQIKVTVYDKNGGKQEFSGRVVGKDVRTDIAVVRIHAGHKLPFAALGDSDKVRVGDWAIAIGSPFNLAQTVTVGVISADRQSLVIEGREYRNLIQTDAAINRGNSGGPLLNVRGEVVGIDTAIYAPTGVFAGIGFAVPINQAKAILEDLVKTGHVVRGWLGVELAREITPAMIKAFGLSGAQGALVNDALKNSPADKAGLKRGDVIRSFDGKPVTSSDQLQSMVAATPPKKSVPMEVVREKRKVILTLQMGERPESADTGEAAPGGEEKKEQKASQKPWMGAHIVTFKPEMADHYRQPSGALGVLVTEVDGGSAAEGMGLAPGDLIRALNQSPTPDVAAFEKVANKANLSEGVVLDILRQGHPLYLSYTKS